VLALVYALLYCESAARSGALRAAALVWWWPSPGSRRSITVAPPERPTWRVCLPGAGLALALWLLASLALRQVVGGGPGRGSVYGPLAAAVAMLAWLYLLALAVLVGAALATLAARAEVLLPPARARLVHDAPQVGRRDAEGDGDVPEPGPVGAAGVAKHQLEVGEPA
jgi:membrane protein